MNGLRVYINPEGMDTSCETSVFYSRRADGPFYRWRYEEKLGRWQFSRVRQPELRHSSLCVAVWKAVPRALQTRLGEHYLD
jgi:hypothetical protein